MPLGSLVAQRQIPTPFSPQNNTALKRRLALLQEGREPDYSEYKEFKLTVENIGYQMLMKMGWKEGDGLGSDGQGIKAPVNKCVGLLFC